MAGFSAISQRSRGVVNRSMSSRGVGISGDPYWSSVVVLLNMDGADGATTFTDATGLRTWTAHGNAQVDTSQGYNAAQFDGAGDYITTPYVKADFDWWAGDFCIDVWLKASAFTSWGYVDGTGKPALIGCADPTSATNYWSFGPLSNGTLSFAYFNGSAQIASGASLSTSTNSCVSLIHAASNNHIYTALNGTVTDHGAHVGTPQSSATSPVVLTLGMINNCSISDFVRAVRITKSTRGYVSDFNPPPAPFTTF